MKPSPRVLLCALLLSGFAGAASADEAAAPQFPDLSPEHDLLQRFVGDWQATSECSFVPGEEPETSTGVYHNRLMGGRWLVCEMTAEMQGASFKALQTIGFDASKKKYVGSWADSMTDHLWVYEGQFDEATRTLTLHAEGPNLMVPGETTRYRDSYRFVADGHIELLSEAIGEKGEWETFMTGTLRRTSE